MLRFSFIYIFLFFQTSYLFCQFSGVLRKDLTEQDGIFYNRGTKFTGDVYDLNEKGRFITLETFKKGILHGKRINYNSRNLSKLASEKFKNGKGIFRTYYSNNKLKSYGLLSKSTKHGEWIYYDKKGMIKAKEFWSMEIPNQLEWEKYYSQEGVIETELFYKLGVLSKEVYYDNDGDVFKTTKN